MVLEIFLAQIDNIQKIIFFFLNLIVKQDWYLSTKIKFDKLFFFWGLFV